MPSFGGGDPFLMTLIPFPSVDLCAPLRARLAAPRLDALPPADARHHALLAHGDAAPARLARRRAARRLAQLGAGHVPPTALWARLAFCGALQRHGWDLEPFRPKADAAAEVRDAPGAVPQAGGRAAEGDERAARGGVVRAREAEERRWRRGGGDARDYELQRRAVSARGDHHLRCVGAVWHVRLAAQGGRGEGKAATYRCCPAR